jgi:hypothetical protein
MRPRYLPLLALLLASLSASCAVLPKEDEPLEDGSHCQDGKACRSGTCTIDELCAPSSCNCTGDACNANGEASSDCDSKWVCVASTSIVEDIGMFFSGDHDNDGYCQLPCSAGCPEHYACGGQFCEPILGWTDPVPNIAWSGAAEGTLSGKDASTTVNIERAKTVSLVASAKSPVDSAIKSFDWTLVNGDSGERIMSSGDSVDLMIDPGGSYRRAELTVTDTKLRASTMYVVFQSCGSLGEQCGYQGSGCCNSCDSATNLCN